MIANIPTKNEILTELIREGISKEDVKSNYDRWATTYDKDLEELGYEAYTHAANKASELFPPEVRRHTRILDVGAGTGLLGSKLREAGFAQIDGLDPAGDMMEVAKEKAIYNNLFVEYLTEKPLDIKEGTYDIVTGSGMFGYSLIPYQSITEMVRLIKSGGFIILSFRECVQEYEEYKGMGPLIDQLERDGKIKVVSKTTYPVFFKDSTGIVLILQRK